MSGVDTRHLSRDSLFMLAEVVLDGQGDAYRIKVRNLSSGGLMAEGAVPGVLRGTRVTVRLRNLGNVDGCVAWVQDNRFGVAFTREIDPKAARISAPGAEFEPPRFVRSAPLLAAGVPADPARIRKI